MLAEVFNIQPSELLNSRTYINNSQSEFALTKVIFFPYCWIETNSKICFALEKFCSDRSIRLSIVTPIISTRSPMGSTESIYKRLPAFWMVYKNVTFNFGCAVHSERNFHWVGVFFCFLLNFDSSELYPRQGMQTEVTHWIVLQGKHCGCCPSLLF